MDDLIKIALGGLIGAVIGPIILEKYREWHRERHWKKPRKELLEKMLKGELRFRSIDVLSRTTGTSHDDCRSLLIELGARGAKLQDGREAWALISRAPLKDVTDHEIIDANEEIVADADIDQEDFDAGPR